MKKILLGLALMGLIHLSAEAQAKYCSKYDQNFKVCQSKNGYTICGTLPASCNGGSIAAKGQNIPSYPYSNPNTTTGHHSKYDVNYPVCMHKDGYAICTEEEAMTQPVTYAQPVAVNPTPKQHCNCYEEHNGILVSYNDATSCNNLRDDEE